MIKTDTIYLDRSGRKVGPLEHTQKRAGFPWFVRLEGKVVRTFTETGCYHADGRESEYDLVCEFVEEPKVVPIYDVPPGHYARGVARTWASYRLLP